MGWFDKKPTSKEDIVAAKPFDATRPDSAATPAPAPPAPVPELSAPEAEAPRGLAALFGSGARSAEQVPPVQSGPAITDGTSVFAESVEIEGSLEGEGDVVLRGQVRGSISITGTLIVAETGRVHADVTAREVVCGGTVEGNIHASDKVRVQGTGLVQGDIDSPSIVIDDGGGVEGFVQMEPPGGDEAYEQEPLPARALPAAGRIGRSPARTTESQPAALSASHPQASEAAPRLTREMLLGLDAPRPGGPAPAAGLLNRPAAAPASQPMAAGIPMPGQVTSRPSAAPDPFGDDAGPLGGAADIHVVGGSGNGDAGPLVAGDDLLDSASARPIPNL